MINLQNIRDHRPTARDEFFFDANIWIFLFSPIGNYQKEKQRLYADFLNRVNRAKTCIWVNALVLSEFCNAWLRFEFNNWKKKPENLDQTDYKKHFVPSKTYKDVIEEIKQTLPQILKITERSSDNFNAVNLDAIYAELEYCDFNDSYYLELARMNQWKIVTDDADLFKNNQLNVEILTANI